MQKFRHYKNISEEAYQAIKATSGVFSEIAEDYSKKIKNLTNEEIDLLAYNLIEELEYVLMVKTSLNRDNDI